jgi:hypothetical protein
MCAVYLYEGSFCMEKAYNTMKRVGALNIALGVITIVTGLVVGILMLTSGGKSLKNKRFIVW